MLRLRNAAALVVTFIVMWQAGAQPVWARSDQVPNLDVKSLCRGIASQSSDPMAQNYPEVSFGRCIQAEQEDRDQLVKEWPTFSSNDKQHCVAEATMGGESSYTELITCLEMARDVRESRQSSAKGGAESSVAK